MLLQSDLAGERSQFAAENKTASERTFVHFFSTKHGSLRITVGRWLPKETPIRSAPRLGGIYLIPITRRGTTARATRLNINVATGAILKRKKLALLGEIGSFRINFEPSARGCNNPNDPTTSGPFLRCTKAITLRSASTKKATPSRSGRIIPSISAGTAISLASSPYSSLHYSPNGGRRRANDLALYLAILFRRSSLNLKTNPQFASAVTKKTTSICCVTTHRARTFLARSSADQLVTTRPVGVLLKDEFLDSSNVKRTNNLPVDVEAFPPTVKS
uniref:Uncharacterized protein n=1 Tax=Brassica oleracea var. oleracea TaxID=109376 RepID=A0A0D3BFV5_BRAOL